MNQFSTSKDVERLNPGFYGKQAQEGHSLPPSSLATASEGVKGVKIAKSTDEGKLNRWESQWLAVLQGRSFAWVGIQNVTFKIGHDCRYTPDFVCYANIGGMVAYEVKGFFRDDAKVKIKVAARMFPWITFILVMKENGYWKEEIVPS